MTHDAGEVPREGDRSELPSTALDRALRALAASEMPDEAAIRPIVQRHVVELRSAGASIQAAVISVKQAITRAERMAGSAPAAERRRLAEQIVTWSIEAYYRSD